MTSPNHQKLFNGERREQDFKVAHQYFVDNSEPEEHIHCAHFGCGKVLTMTEQLYGSLCHEHSVAPKRDITKHINY